MSSVLIVDDNDEFREECAFLFRNNGFRVSEAVDGQDAVFQFKKEWNDTVILDLNMPVWDGIRTAEVLGTLHPKVRIIFISGDPSRLKEAAVKAGLSLICLPKTIDPEYLVKLVRNLPQVYSA